MSTRQNKTRGVCIAIATAALLSLPAAEVRADAAESVGIAALGLFVLSDIGFAIYDIGIAADGKHPDQGVAIAEIVVTSPQTLLFNAGLVGVSTSDAQLADLAISLGTIPTACVTALTTHGIWSVTTDMPPGNALDGVSVFVGVNTALTSSAVGRLAVGSLHSRFMGIVELALVTPGLAIGIYESTFQRPQQLPWALLTGWSGALWMHGLASSIAGDKWTVDKQDPQENQNPTRRAARLRFPRFMVTPAQIPALGGSAPGISVAGVF